MIKYLGIDASKETLKNKSFFDNIILLVNQTGVLSALKGIKIQLINAIKLETMNSKIKKIKKNYTLNSHSKKFKEKVNQVKNKNIRDALSLLLDAAKND